MFNTGWEWICYYLYISMNYVVFRMGTDMLLSIYIYELCLNSGWERICFYVGVKICSTQVSIYVLCETYQITMNPVCIEIFSVRFLFLIHNPS